MKAFFLVWVLVLALVASWTFFPPPLPTPTAQTSDGPGYNEIEPRTVEGRVYQRRSAFRVLDKPWSDICTDDGRKQLVSGLQEYYYHRQNQMQLYPANFGKAGADYIAKQWSTTDDTRIDAQTQLLYGKGYFKPEEFESVARKMILKVIADERVTGSGCAH